MRATDLAAAAVLFRASGSFHEALPAPTLEDLSTHVVHATDIFNK